MRSRLWRILLVISLLLLDLFVLNTTYVRKLSFVYIANLVITGVYVLTNMTFLSPPYLFYVFFVMLFYVQPILTYTFELDLLPFAREIHIVYALIHVSGLLLFCIGDNLASNGDLGRLTPTNTGSISFRRVRIAIFVLLIAVVLSISIVMLQVGPSNILRSGRVDLKLHRSLGMLMLTYSTHLFSSLVFLVFVSPREARTFSMFTWMVMFLLIETVYFLCFRTRSHFVQHFMTAMVSLYYRSHFTSKRIINVGKRQIGSSNFKRKLRIIALMFLLLISAITMRFLRGYFEPDRALRDFYFNFDLFLTLSVKSGDLGYADAVMRLIELFPRHYGFLGGQSYYRILFAPIPRFIWPEKPPSTQRIVGSIFYPNNVAHTTPPGVVGDTYINFGIYGCFLMLLFGMFFGYLGKEKNRFNIGLWAMSSAWIFHLVRGGFTNPLVMFAFQFFLMKTLFGFITCRFRPQMKATLQEVGTEHKKLGGTPMW